MDLIVWIVTFCKQSLHYMNMKSNIFHFSFLITDCIISLCLYLMYACSVPISSQFKLPFPGGRKGLKGTGNKLTYSGSPLNECDSHRPFSR